MGYIPIGQALGDDGQNKDFAFPSVGVNNNGEEQSDLNASVQKKVLLCTPCSLSRAKVTAEVGQSNGITMGKPSFSYRKGEEGREHECILSEGWTKQKISGLEIEIPIWWPGPLSKRFRILYSWIPENVMTANGW